MKLKNSLSKHRESTAEQKLRQSKLGSTLVKPKTKLEKTSLFKNLRTILAKTGRGSLKNRH